MNAVEYSAATPRSTVYERFGVRPIINAQGTTTTLGGSMLLPEVAVAMAEAGRSMVLLGELNDRAGEMIAHHTGAEAGLVTAGAASGMLLQAAAVIAGSDMQKVKSLPNTAKMNNEIVILEHHRNVGYLQAWRTAGAVLVEVSIDGAESADDAVSLLMKSIGSRTAAIGYVASRWMRQDPPGFLAALTESAHKAGVQVIVDAAAMLPPAENLRRYVDQGVDLVAFSGGKAIRAPQSTGILAGSREMINAARANAAPNSAIGRPAKVCKEEIVGLMTALDLYVRRDHAADQLRWRQQVNVVADALRDLAGIQVEVLHDEVARPVPEAAIHFKSDYKGPTSEQISRMLLEEDPRIVVGGTNARGDDLFVNPHNLADGEEAVVATRLRLALTGRS